MCFHVLKNVDVCRVCVCVPAACGSGHGLVRRYKCFLHVLKEQETHTGKILMIKQVNESEMSLICHDTNSVWS